MSAQAVITPEYRFRFVEKSLSEVGDGKPFPMEVTGATVAEKLDKIAEIYYRVKDAQFAGGYIDWYWNETSHYTMLPPSAVPSNRSYSLGVGESYTFRGYTTQVEDENGATVSAHNSDYLAEAYDRGDGEEWRDIDDNERGMWLVGVRDESQIPTTLPLWNDKDGYPEMTNAFSYYCFTEAFSSYESPSNLFFIAQDWVNDDPVPNLGSADVEVVFNGQIAIVRESPSDPFWAVTNKFYIGLQFTSQDIGYIPTFSTDSSLVSGSPETPCNFVISISSGDLSCPIYADTTDVALTGSDFVLEAIEWWPYVKLGGLPVWDSTTGAKL